jgi:hypothetical protein
MLFLNLVVSEFRRAASVSWPVTLRWRKCRPIDELPASLRGPLAGYLMNQVLP